MTDVDYFLEHHGIKGQRWGVRKQQRLSERSANLRAKANNLDQKSVEVGARRERIVAALPKVKTGLKVAGVVGGAAAVVAGGIYAKKVLGKSGKLPVKKAVDLVTAEGPGWKVSGNKRAVDTFVQSMMEQHYKLGQIM